jgi:hypothetical protein
MRHAQRDSRRGLLTSPASGRRLNGHNQLPKIILGVRFTDGMEVRSQAQTAAA